MLNDLQSLAAEIGKAPLKAKLTSVLAVLALLAVISIAGMVASKPHYVTLYSGLGDGERVAVEKALASAKVSYRVSQPPGPYVVYVDQSGYDEAQIAVALEEGLRHAPLGINTGEGGASAIFMSSGERQQSMLKREWQETEHLLEQLDFVGQAVVTTSIPDSSPLRQRQPLSVSVALTLDAPGGLSDSEANAVAKLVRFRFGVPAENVIISDQSGRILYDPSREQQGPDLQSLLEHSAGYDRDLAAKVNQALTQAFGERKALVTINSEWDHDQSTIVAETIDPETVTLSAEKRASKSPLGAPSTAGGIPGSSSNLAADDGFGTEHAGVPQDGQAGTGASAAPAVSETSDEKTTFDAARSRTQTVRTTPRLERLSVSLVIDESLAEKRDEIIELVKAAVGFDAKRQDLIGVSTTSFATEEQATEPGAEADAAPAAPNRTLELLLTRGVEIVAALAFVIVLLKSLKGPKRTATATVAGSARADDGLAAPDPALVARAQIEELVRSNPRRVGEILSRWASEETAGTR